MALGLCADGHPHSPHPYRSLSITPWLMQICGNASHQVFIKRHLFHSLFNYFALHPSADLSVVLSSFLLRCQSFMKPPRLTGAPGPGSHFALPSAVAPLVWTFFAISLHRIKAALLNFLGPTFPFLCCEVFAVQQHVLGTWATTMTAAWEKKNNPKISCIFPETALWRLLGSPINTAQLQL